MKHTIRELDAHLQNQIAAGEVVERPSSIVKELVENSIDAESRTIKLFLHSDSLDFEVTDDGCGIEFDQVPLALKRHTTSKIYKTADLQSISTLGFRGEALASIAAVSHLSISTRTPEQTQGRKITVHNGTVKEDSPVSNPTGTSISISRLFDQVPARKKFLKTHATEIKNMKEEFFLLVLAWPDTQFVLYEDEREIANFPDNQPMEERIALMHSELRDALVPFSKEGLDFSISGYVSKPQVTYKRATRCYFFINKRPVTAPILLKAVKDAFYTIIPDPLYPACFVAITLDPLLVDVNVHPRKKEVRFANPQELYRILTDTLKKALLAKDITKELKIATGTAGSSGYHISETKLPVFDSLPTSSAQTSYNNSAPRTSSFSVRFIAQIQNSYLLFEDSEGLIVVDQHALHERVNYTKLKESMRSAIPYKQQLMIPILFEVPLKEVSLFENIKEIIEQIGFEIDAFSGNTFRIRAIPRIFSGINFEKIWPDLLDDLIQSKKPETIEKLIDETLHSIACRSSIMFNQAISEEEALRLWSLSEQTPFEISCPHGRPTKFRITYNELNKYFLR